MICLKCNGKVDAHPTEFAWVCTKGHSFSYDKYKDELLVEISIGRATYVSARRVIDLFPDRTTAVYGEKWARVTL